MPDGVLDGQDRDEADGVTPDMRAAYESIVTFLEPLTARQRRHVIKELQRRHLATPPPAGLEAAADRVMALVEAGDA